MKKTISWVSKVLVNAESMDILIVLLFLIFFIGIGYWLTIINPIFLTSVRVVTDVITLFILGFVFGYSVFCKNVEYRSLIACASASMFIMYVLYDVYHINSAHEISAAGFNVATSINIFALWFISSRIMSRKK